MREGIGVSQTNHWCASEDASTLEVFRTRDLKTVFAQNVQNECARASESDTACHSMSNVIQPKVDAENRRIAQSECPGVLESD